MLYNNTYPSNNIVFPHKGTFPPNGVIPALYVFMWECSSPVSNRAGYFVKAGDIVLKSSGFIRREVIGGESFGFYETKIGALYIISDVEAITAVMFSPPAGRLLKPAPTMLTNRAALQIQEYLDGRRKRFDLPLKPAGASFHYEVWAQLMNITYGRTRTYREIAIAIGNPKATRSVVHAINRNPLSILVPCHRVIGSNGKLIGYGGGLYIKSTLLELEQGGFVLQ